MVDNAIKEKRRLWKEWKADGSNEIIWKQNHNARSEIYIPKKQTEEKRFQNILR